MTAGRIASTVQVSMLVIAAVTLAACGGSDSGGGASQASVPNVVGDTQAAATTAITGAGLTVGGVTNASSASVASGDVISENPAAGASVASGSAVALVISSGPATVAVPNVVGDTQTAATSAITGAGLTVGAVTNAASASIASGEVISENPAAGASVASGSPVALVISSGPPTYTIGGTLIGLAPSATVHVLNGSDSLAVSANGSFTLPTGIVSGGTYSVTVGTPTSAQTCGVQSGSGTVASADVTTVVVYCTYNVSTATLNNVYTGVAADFGDQDNGTTTPFDFVGTTTYDGMGNLSTTGTVNIDGSIYPGIQQSGPYSVSNTTNPPALNNDGSPGGIEGVNGDVVVTANMTSGMPPAIGIIVLPNSNTTTATINGNYTLVDLSAQLSNGAIYGYEATITLTNGAISGTFTQNTAGTISTGTASGQWSVSNGVLTSVGSGSGAVSADGDLIVLADTNSGDDPYINVAVRRGSGVTPATVQGVYSVVTYIGRAITTTGGSIQTIMAYGNGTFSFNGTDNDNGTIVTTGNSGSATYSVSDDGTLTITQADGSLLTGAISADGNVLVLSGITSGEKPQISVGVRQ
jgi:hypothetical protein